MMMPLDRKLEIMEGFTSAFQKYNDRSIFETEIACLKAQFPAVFLMPEEEDLVGRFYRSIADRFFPAGGRAGLLLQFGDDGGIIQFPGNNCQSDQKTENSGALLGR